MIEGLVWLAASVASVAALAFVLPRAVIASVAAYRNRNREQPTAGTPLAACPQCGGNWGAWSALRVTQRPNNPVYPSLYGTYDVHSQTRTCTECGFGERRVIT